jgi:signal peptidase I
MSPTLMGGDELIFSTIGGMHRGDIVLLETPGRTSILDVKRLVAVPGDLVTIHQDVVSVNGEYEPYALQSTFTGIPSTIGLSFRLGPDQYLVLGDNRPQSLDSRTFGAIPRKAIIGRVWLRWGGPGGVGLLGLPV